MKELPLDRTESNESVFMWAFDLIELDGIRHAARPARRAQGNAG
jgi:hypothetical protein